MANTLIVAKPICLHQHSSESLPV